MEIDDIDRKHWLDEKVLQRYVKENPSKWNKFFKPKKIEKIEYNPVFNKFPDLTFHLKGGDEVPVEVEWATSNFKSHKHQTNDHKIFAKFKREKGFVLVGFKDDELVIRQETMLEEKKDVDGFKKWLKRQSSQLVDDTLEEYSPKRRGKSPILWIVYVTAARKGIPNYKIALKEQTYGFSKLLQGMASIRKNDLVMFVIAGSWQTKKGSGRSKKLTGKFRKIQVFRITKKYFHSTTKIWKDKIYPHRFKFDSDKQSDWEHQKPLVFLEDTQNVRLQAFEKEQLRKIVYSSPAFGRGDHSTLVECMLHSKQKK